MGHLLHALQANGASRSALEDTHARPDIDHDGRAVRWYLFTLIARSSYPRGTWQPQSCPVPGGGSWSPGGTWRSQSRPALGGGSWGHRAHGGLGAAMGPGGGSWSHDARAVPELACARSGSRCHGARGGPGAAVGHGGGSWSYEAHGSSGAALC
jgi:hypothetical protein